MDILSLLCQVCIWGDTIDRDAALVCLVSFPGPIYESRWPGTHCLYMRRISKITPRKMWGTVYVTVMCCYHGDPVHAQALCTIPSPPVYRAWERGYSPKKFLHHECVYVSSCSTNFRTVYVMYLRVHAYEFCSYWVTCSVYFNLLILSSCKITPRRQALLCLLAKNCSETGYTRLVEALCNEHNIKLLKV